MTHLIQTYFDTITGMMRTVMEQERDALEWIAESMADCIQNGRSVFIFGPSHAGMFAEEMFYRAGGLVVTNPRFHSGMMLDRRPVKLTSDMECLPGYGRIILNESPIKPGDFLIIHSVAARNPVVIDMAIAAKEKGVRTAAIVNMAYAMQVTSRDPSGKMLYEVADCTLDTHGCYSDACVEVEGMPQRVAPASTPISAFIANALVLETCDRLLKRGVEPPVFQSANVDGGGEFNQALMRRWADQIHYM